VKICVATSLKAALDHGSTQTGEVQLTILGKFLNLVRSFSPTGDKHIQI